MEILERTDELNRLHGYFDMVETGRGQMVFVGGEGGIGKTTLIDRFIAEVGSRANIAMVSCDSFRMSGPFGPLFDIAHTFGPGVERLLAEQAPRDRIFRAVESALRNSPDALILIGDDAQWGDESSLELLRFLGRRIGSLSVLFIVAYRNDEISPYHPLRRVLGDLVNAHDVYRMTLAPLTIAAIESLAQGSHYDPVELRERTSGNPFYITEILATDTPDIPDTVRDAVLARVSRISPEGRAVLDAAAIIGIRFDPDLLAQIVDGPTVNEIEECMGYGVLHSAGQMIAFRHGIARDTIVDAISPARYRALQRRIVTCLKDHPRYGSDSALIAFHAEEANDAANAYAYAVAAAKEAAAFLSHREAAAQYGRALRFAQSLTPADRASLLERRAYELCLTGRIDDAIAAQKAAVSLRKETGHVLKHGDDLRHLSRFCWMSGRNDDADRFADAALDVLAPFADSPELAMAYSTLSQLRMLAYGAGEAIEWGERAMTIASALGHSGILVHAMTNVGAVKLLKYDEEGRVLLERALALAVEHGLEDDAARAWIILAWTSLVKRQLAVAGQYLDQGLTYTVEHDLLVMELHLRVNRALVDLARGETRAAEVAAEHLIQHPAALTPTRIHALVVLGSIAARRGEDSTALLDEALELALETHELQRYGPVRLARAEAAWLSGDLDRLESEALACLDAADELGERWLYSELILLLHRADRLTRKPHGLVAPIALELAGDHSGAAKSWLALGIPLEAARAKSFSEDADDLFEALVAFEHLGARRDAYRLNHRLRARGVQRIPRGPRTSTKSNYKSLTDREFEVLLHLATGKLNREIAEALYLSPKTVGHHVSSILAKLEVDSRSAAVDQARKAGIDLT